MDNLAKCFKSLSDKNRLRVVIALTEYEELCACQIIELLQVTGATVSRHLGVLINSGILESRKDSRWVYYRLKKGSKKSDFTALIDWIIGQASNSKDARNDMKGLKKIMGYDLLDLCRKQRGEKCCPPCRINDSKGKKIL